jgi:predicted ribosomally synthesized peptide with nif11-like leader
MSADQLTAFWEAVEADASLQEKLSASTDGEIDTPIEVDAVIAIAKDAGFSITAGDLLKADAQAILELNDDELQEVAGGLWGIPGTQGQPFGSVVKYGKLYGDVRGMSWINEGGFPRARRW